MLDGGPIGKHTLMASAVCEVGKGYDFNRLADTKWERGIGGS